MENKSRLRKHTCITKCIKVYLWKPHQSLRQRFEIFVTEILLWGAMHTCALLADRCFKSISRNGLGTKLRNHSPALTMWGMKPSPSLLQPGNESSLSSVGEQGHRGGGDLSFHFKCAWLGSRDLEAVEECVPEDTVFRVSMKWKNIPPTWSLLSQARSNPTFPSSSEQEMGNPQRLLQSVFTRSTLPSRLQGFNNRKRLQWRDMKAQVDYGKTKRFNSLPYTEILFANQWSETSVYFL